MIGAVYTVREQGGEIHLLASDFKDYFERCSRTISARIERAVGVQPGVSERLRATEMESTARIVTGVGMTRDIPRCNGIRQGSEDSCDRSMYYATLCDMMYDRFTVGLPIRIPGGIVGLVQVWVADDAAMPRHTHDLLQGGDRGGAALSDVYANSWCVAATLAVCLVSLFVSVCRSCVPSSSVSRPPIPRWCPVRA